MAYNTGEAPLPMASLCAVWLLLRHLGLEGLSFHKPRCYRLAVTHEKIKGGLSPYLRGLEVKTTQLECSPPNLGLLRAKTGELP